MARHALSRLRRSRSSFFPSCSLHPSVPTIQTQWGPKQSYRATQPLAPVPQPSVPRSEPTTARESYEQKLKEFDARSRAPAPYEMTSEETQTEALRRHQEWMRSAGIQERPVLGWNEMPQFNINYAWRDSNRGEQRTDRADIQLCADGIAFSYDDRKGQVFGRQPQKDLTEA